MSSSKAFKKLIAAKHKEFMQQHHSVYVKYMTTDFSKKGGNQ